MNITEELYKQLKKFESIPFLFVGAGISRRYLNTESWEGLLRNFAKYADKAEFAYEVYKERVRGRQDKLNNLPQIADYIEKDFNATWLTAPEWQESRAANKHFIEAGISPFKIEIANHFCGKSPADDLSEGLLNEIELLKKISAKSVAGIITTNYDPFMESIFPNFKTYIGQEELLFSQSQSIGEIYKIHGCCTRPDTIIINQDDYESFRERNAYLAAKLLTIFIEHPIVFLGYSINDQNIEEILEAIIKCLSTENLARIKDRLIFIERGEPGQDGISTYHKACQGGKSIEMTRIVVNDLSIIYEAIYKNQAKYRTAILRKLKEEIYQLVVTNDPRIKMRVVGINDDTSLDQVEAVVGVGVFAEFGRKGYSSITAEEVYRDVVFNNGDYDHTLIVEETLPVLLKHHAGSIPIYKYIVDYPGELSGRILNEKKDRYDELLNKSIRDQMASSSLFCDSIEDICLSCDDIKALNIIPRLPRENIRLTSLEEFLQRVFTNHPHILSPGDTEYDVTSKTGFRRLIKIYDWLKYNSQ